jgi:ATP-dependent DNA helicase RecG
MDLNTPLKSAGKIYQMYSARLAKLNIYTLEDLLFHLPFRYDDFSLISKIAQVQAGEIVTIQGLVLSMQNIYTKTHKKIQKAVVADDSGSIEIIWYNQPFLTKYIRINDAVSLSGKADFFIRKLVLNSPEYELITNNVTIHTGRLVPVYPETKGLTSKWLRRQIYKLLNEPVNDFIPQFILDKYTYPRLADALNKVHFPDNLAQAQKARERIAFDELLLLQLKSKQRRLEWEKSVRGIPFEVLKFEKQIAQFISSLPFTLTTSQIKAVSEILQDINKDKPMNRLLQGDVGSGKTIVGTIIMYLAYLNGFQSVLMAPTEILAEQHYQTISKFLSPFSVKVAISTGSKKLKMKNYSSSDPPTPIESGPTGGESRSNNRTIEQSNNSGSRHAQTLNLKDTDILIGTHAVLNKNLKFDKLGLVIIDEQQRFGVEQRTIIRKKGKNPHFLTMTATPIPRTVALTMYGDLELSYLDELPKGRKIIKTWLVPPEKRDAAYHWIRKQIKELNSQIFIICPFIEESENSKTVKAATIEFERLRKEIFPDLKLGLLHGKLKAKIKDQVLSDFRDKKIDILVATPVVEVGIDIANATVIMIEGAERFGLSQLHQLRGRVGRGDKQSFCLLFSDAQSENSLTRLKAMEIKQNGAELAEIDLKLRGPGDVFGTAQSGIPKLKVASFSDFSLIKRTKLEAEELFPKLSLYPVLKSKVDEISIENVSPD